MNRVGQPPEGARQFGSYLLLNQIGRGGFAEVYLGEHIYLKTKAAIKVLHTHLAQEEHAGFLSEAQTIAHLQHPHIVRVLEFGAGDDTPYLVMEYAPNGTLRGRYPKGTVLPLPTILPLVKKVAAALQYAHDQNLIHRDVKPENILLGEHDEVLLSDFGIALIVQGIGSQQHQEVVGTIGYMAPEQLLGKPHFASDQYALAIIVYEWLTGARPFQGSYAEVSSQHIFASPPPLREKAPGVPLAVEAVVMKALSKDPKQRFATIQEFANALEAVTVLAPAHTLPMSPTGPRITPVRLKVALVTLVLLILGTVAYPLLARLFLTPPPSKEQLLYLQATSGTPAIADPLRTNSPLLWVNVNDYGTCLFTGEALHASGNSGGTACLSERVLVTDFAFQVQVTIIKGDTAGLWFRQTQLNPRSYDFFFSSTGQCGLFLGNASNMGSIQSLLNLQRCAGISTDVKQANLITVIARKSDIYLYINKQYVAHVVDNSAASGSIGVFGINRQKAAADAAFSNLQIWNL